MAISRFFSTLLIGLLGSLSVSGSAWARDAYPAGHMIRLIVPFPPGGNIDFTARVLAPALSAALKQSVTVVNMPGADGIIGASYVVRSPADGYTLLLGSGGAVSSSPALNQSATYNPVTDMTAIGGIQSVPLVLEVAFNSPINNLQQLIAYSKTTKAVTMAAAGFGSPAHLTIDYLSKHAIPDAVYVPYEGSGPALTNLMGGQVFSMVDQVNSSLPYLTSKKLKAIVQFGAQRSSLLPDVPTLAEQGVTGYIGTSWTGLFGPAHLPANVMAVLSQALKTALADKTVIQHFREVGADMTTMSQAQFQAFVADDFRKWQAFAKTPNAVKPQ